MNNSGANLSAGVGPHPMAMNNPPQNGKRNKW